MIQDLLSLPGQGTFRAPYFLAKILHSTVKKLGKHTKFSIQKLVPESIPNASASGTITGLLIVMIYLQVSHDRFQFDNVCMGI
jgi:hypothetical protein